MKLKVRLSLFFIFLLALLLHCNIYFFTHYLGYLKSSNRKKITKLYNTYMSFKTTFWYIDFVYGNIIYDEMKSDIE